MYYYIKFYNKLIDLSQNKNFVKSSLIEFNEVKKRALKRTDISDHLVNLFIESLVMKPKLIVELGVRGGESTFVLERVAKLCRSKLISVDIEDCSNLSSYKNWIFIKKNDIKFAKEFKNWCMKFNIKPKIDILLIDTSHQFKHTLQEIELWFSFLSKRSKVFLHDTNMRKIYYRKDGSIGYGWDNKRGVIRALEKYFKKSFDETKSFTDFENIWLIKHYSYSNGFTILEKLDLFN